MTSKINLTWSWSFIITYILYIRNCIAVVQSLSCLTLCNLRHSNTPAFSVLHYLPKFAQTHIYWVDDVIQPSHPLSPSSHPALNLSQHQGLFQESALCIMWPKYWSFSFSISPSNEYSGLISLRNDWFDLLAVQGTLKSLLQHHSPNASVLQCLAFFMVQFSHPYKTTGKTIALTIQTSVSTVMPLLCNILGLL